MKTIRTHRLGAVTCGITMVVFGLLFILRTFAQIISFRTIFRLWPLVIIGLGVELLISTIREEEFVYDKAAVILLFAVTFFSMCMAGADIAINQMSIGINI